MTDSSHDAGVIQALAQRMETQRLPRALDLKERVDRGETIDEFDMQFLKDVFADAQHLQPLVERHPELQELVAKLIHLYHDITEKALENEKAKSGSF